MGLHQELPEQVENERQVGQGTSQRQRFSPELEPSVVLVDERSIEHDMVFAKNYAAYLDFVNAKGEKTATWEQFFGSDSTVLLAEAALFDIDRYRQAIGKGLTFLTKHQDDTVEHQLKATLLALFGIAGKLAAKLDSFQQQLPEELPLTTSLRFRIQSELAVPFRNLISAYRAGLELGLYGEDDAPDTGLCGPDCPPLHRTLLDTFSGYWITTSALSWSDYITSISTLTELYGHARLSAARKINHIGSHNRFTSFFDRLIGVYAQTMEQAGSALKKSLSERNDHAPHATLFLVFLKLLQLVRNHTNTLTERHLDFYYKEVLRFTRKAAEPGHVHLVFELARQCNCLLLPAGTPFVAGKADNGQNIIYTLDEELSLNKAKIASLRSVHRSESRARSYLYAYPDKTEAEAMCPAESDRCSGWNPFSGNTDRQYLAQTGFAIASHYLLLEEGARTITLSFDISGKETPVSEEELANSFEFLVTTEKGWVALKASPVTDKSETTPKQRKATVQLQLALDGSLPAVTALRKDLHGEGFPEGLPLIKAMVRQASLSSLPLERLESLRINPENSCIEVSCGYTTNEEPDANGLKGLHLSNGFGPVNPDKPFMPFGPEPKTGDYLVIGSDEVFQKKGARIQLRIEWKGMPENDALTRESLNELAPSAGLAWLQNGTWKDAPVTGLFKLFEEEGSTALLPAGTSATLPDGVVNEIHFNRQPWSIRSKNGFMKLTIAGNFGHKLYRETLGLHLVNVANKELKGNKPVEPYTPEISSLTMSYKASTGFSDGSLMMYHLTPFGYLETERGSGSVTRLLAPAPDKGEFYIGIDDVQPETNLHLLFRVVEGSANPMTKKPEQHLSWSYLGNNAWKPLTGSAISDATRELAESGIIRVTVPPDATSSTTLFPGTGRFWLKAEISEKPDAVCRCLDVCAQAARLTCTTVQDTAGEPRAQLAPGTITKIGIPNAKIKKVHQPYASFGGRDGEHDNGFRVRVSERLRHKNRASTPWDYERIILEAFPSIYKVKCLNHTWYEPGEAGQAIYRDPAPGHVTIVTIPDLKGVQGADALRPWTSLGDLEKIKARIAQHISPFTTIHIHNPLFETVQIACHIRFYPGTDKALYQKILRNELVRFLSPWTGEKTGEIHFSGKIRKSALINFIDELPYIDYVTDLMLYHTDSRNVTHPDQDEITASTPISILVAAAAGKHEISVIEEN